MSCVVRFWCSDTVVATGDWSTQSDSIWIRLTRFACLGVTSEGLPPPFPQPLPAIPLCTVQCLSSVREVRSGFASQLLWGSSAPSLCSPLSTHSSSHSLSLFFFWQWSISFLPTSTPLLVTFHPYLHSLLISISEVDPFSSDNLQVSLLSPASSSHIFWLLILHLHLREVALSPSFSTLCPPEREELQPPMGGGGAARWGLWVQPGTRKYTARAQNRM